jgi:glycosyltransferase involved in cell wall biosynthesis
VPLKILLASRAYPPDVAGGGEISTRLLALSLAKEGAAVVVLTIGRTPSVLHVDGVKIIRRTAPNLYWSIHSAKMSAVRKALWHFRDSWLPSIADLATVLDQEKPDVVHTSTIEDISTGLWEHCARRKMPVVHTLRSYSLLCSKATMFRQGRNCDRICGLCNTLSWPKRARTRYVRGVVGISQFILDKHLTVGCFPNARTTVIPNPVADDWVATTSGETSAERSGDVSVVVGFLGRLAPEKGVESVFDALRKSGRRDIELRIAGDGEPSYMERLERVAIGLNVKFSKSWVEPRAFLGSIDALIVPSLWHEPFGRVVAEAHAAGRPVICSSRGALPELVKNNQNGLIYSPSDGGALSAILRRLSRESLGALSKDIALAKSNYEARGIARQHLQFYNSLQ